MQENNDIVLLSTGMSISNKIFQLECIQTKKDKLFIYYYENFYDYIPVPHASSIIKSNIAKQTKYDINLNVGEDHDYFRRLLKNKKYAFANEILYNYNLGYSFTIGRYIQ